MSAVVSSNRSERRSSGLSFSQSSFDNSSVPSNGIDPLRSNFGHIESLTISNFKSYGGVTTIGPFSPFSCIIGPNGSGKSNLMDAISFVLGVKTQQLRGKKLSDLIHRSNFSQSDSSRQRGDEPDQAFVELTYNSKKLKPRDHEHDDLEDDDHLNGVGPEFEEETMTFRRTINRNGGTVNRFNDTTMSLSEYEEELSKIGVIVRARNFLVFQGDVTSIASKTGKQLTKWVLCTLSTPLHGQMM